MLFLRPYRNEPLRPLTSASIYSGVVPQQPPTMRRLFSSAARRPPANSSGRTSYTVLLPAPWAVRRLASESQAARRISNIPPPQAPAPSVRRRCDPHGVRAQPFQHGCHCAGRCSCHQLTVLAVGVFETNMGRLLFSFAAKTAAFVSHSCRSSFQS